MGEEAAQRQAETAQGRTGRSDSTRSEPGAASDAESTFGT